MGNCCDSKESLAIEQMALLRALYSQRLSLKHNIEVHKMKVNFDSIHLSMLQGDESLHFYTAVAKRIADVHSLIGHVRKYGRKNQEVSKFVILLHLETEKSKNFTYIKIATPEDLIASETKKVEKMKKKYKKIVKRLASLREIFEENYIKIDEKVRKSSDVYEVCAEIQDLKHYQMFLNSTKNFFCEKKQMAMKAKYGKLQNEMKDIPQTLFVLNQSRLLVNEYRNKLEELRERVDNKILECVNKHNDFHSNIMMLKLDNPIPN